MKTLILLWAACLIHSVAHAAPVTLDFDDLPSGTVIDNQFAPLGVLFSSTFGDVKVFSGCCAHTGTHSLDGGGFREVVVTFVDPTDARRAATTDFFSVTLGDIDLPGNGLTAFDIAGNLIGQAFAACAAPFDCPGDSFSETLNLSVAGMHRIVIAAGGQLFGAQAQGEATVDTLVFNAVAAHVPEASRQYLLGAGLAVLGLIARRRPRAQAQ
jgi:hypothetical protein